MPSQCRLAALVPKTPRHFDLGADNERIGMKSQAFRLLVQTSLVLCCTPACSSKESDQASSNKVKGGPDLDGAVTTGNFAAPFHVSITVPNVQPSEEGTKCIKLPLGNAEAVE